MSFSILALVLWGGAAVLAFLVVHRAALRALWNEPVLAQPVLIVESDDWGPGPVADADALAGLASRLAAVRDQRGRPAVMTLGVVCSLPDGAAMLADGLARYRRRALDAPEFAPMVEAMRAGCGAGVFALQRHGMEHFWPDALLARARVDASLRDWLADPQARSEGLPSHLQSRWIDASVLPSRPLDPAAVQCAVDEEARLLERLFPFLAAQGGRLPRPGRARARAAVLPEIQPPAVRARAGLPDRGRDARQWKKDKRFGTGTKQSSGRKRLKRQGREPLRVRRVPSDPECRIEISSSFTRVT